MVILEDQWCSVNFPVIHTTKLELLVMALEPVASVNQQLLPELQLSLFGFIQILNPNFGFYILRTVYRKVASSRPVYYSKDTGLRPKVTVHKDQISPSKAF